MFSFMDSVAVWFRTPTGIKFVRVSGILLTIVCAGLIIYGNVFATSQTPQTLVWSEPAKIWVCDTAPAWVTQKLDADLKRWAEVDHVVDSNVVHGPCQLCAVSIDGSVRTQTSCVPGYLAIDLRDQWFSEEHAGECVRSGSDNISWATILVPSVIYGSDDVEDTRMLPADADSLVLGHELGHCAFGYEHNIGPTIIPYVAHLNPKTGHIMNPDLYNAGWLMEGL